MPKIILNGVEYAGGGGGSGGGTGNVSSAEVQNIKPIDRAEYNALPVKDPKTLYLIKG